jgi:acyl carrier protein
MRISMDRLKKVIFECFPNIKIENTLLEIGCCEDWDSLGNFNLIMAVEEEFKITFSAEEISNLNSYGSLLEILKDRKVL